MVYKEYIFYIFISIALSRNQNNSIIFENQYKFCNHRIYSDSSLFSENEIKSLCSQMKVDDRYLLLLTNKDINFDEEDYTSNCQRFHYFNCNRPLAKCPYVFTICIFLNHNKIFFKNGYKVTRALNDYEQNRIKNKYEIDLEKKEYFNTTIYVLNEVDLLYLYYARIHGFGSLRNFKTTFFNILFILICIGICYLYYKKKKEELPYTRLIDNPNYNINNINSDISEDEQVILIHNHLVDLEQLINEINQNSKKTISYNKCLICMKRIAIIKNLAETGNTRFNCHFLHIYHTFCLNKYNLKFCLMCKDMDSNASKIKGGFSNSNLLNLEDVKNFIKNLII